MTLTQHSRNLEIRARRNQNQKQEAELSATLHVLQYAKMRKYYYSGVATLARVARE